MKTKASIPDQYQPFKPLDKLSLSNLETSRLIMRGGSVLDWHKLNLTKSEAQAFCKVQRLDINNLEDIALIERIKEEAIDYVKKILDLPVPKPVQKASLVDLLVIAGNTSNRHRQFCACTLLKAMHIINYFDANEARQALLMTEQEVTNRAERKVYRTIGHMMANRFPVVEFKGGRKKRRSIITKIMSKESPLSAQLFDKIRFRILTDNKEDILPVISYLAGNLFPFNNVIAGESRNNIIQFASFCKEHPPLKKLFLKLQLSSSLENELQPLSNRHSSRQYKTIQWVVDMPWRVPNYKGAFSADSLYSFVRPVLYTRVEIQILDRHTERQNEKGHSSHKLYKMRQLKYVSDRLKLGLKKKSKNK